MKILLIWSKQYKKESSSNLSHKNNSKKATHWRRIKWVCMSELAYPWNCGVAVEGGQGECAPPLVDSRRLSPPLLARRLGLALVALMLRCTPRWLGDCAVPTGAPTVPPGAPPLRESELPDRDPSLSGWKTTPVWTSDNNFC